MRQSVHVKVAGTLRVPSAKIDELRLAPSFMMAILMVCAVTTTAIRAADGPSKVAQSEPVTVSAGPDWLPLEVNLDIEPGSAVDFSRVLPRHEPAGKFGRLVVTAQGKFAFENRDTPVRFYGVDLCCSAQYLPHELADRLADRLVRLGYNAVRIHHYERELLEPAPGEMRFKTDRLDQFDYLFAALKKRGIYVTTDLYVSRLIPLADVYPTQPASAGKGGSVSPARADQWTFENFYRVGPGYFDVQNYKMAVFVNDRAYENFKLFSRALLEHRNPYTKLRYADDPGLASLSLMNEDCPGNFIGGVSGKIRDDWQRAWNRWLAKRYPNRESLAAALGELAKDEDPAKENVPLPGTRRANTSAFGAVKPAAKSKPTPRAAQGQQAVVVLNMFLAEVARDFFLRTRKFLRDELRCQTPLTDCNGWTNPVQLQAVRADFDYVDDHFYVDHPQFLDPLRQPPSRSANHSPVADGGAGVRRCAFTRLLGKPFTITEFNYCGPGRFRGVSGMMTGALAAVQDWDGLWRHVYSYSRENIERPAAMYYFDVAADPLSLAAERAGFCLFLRGDLQPARHAVAITAAPDDLLVSARTACDKTPVWGGLAWVTRVGWRIGEPKPAENELPLPFSGRDAGLFAPGTEKTVLDAFRQRGWLDPANRTDFTKNRFQSESGEVTIDGSENVLTIDTARTAGGFAPAGKRIETRAASIEVLDTTATVWVSSLDGKPIADSRRLLITHLTDLQNTGTRYGDQNRQLLLAWGQLPHLVRAGRAAITLRRHDAEHAKVFGLAVNGRRTGEVQTEVRAGALTIPLSISADGRARMLYEVQVGP